MLVNCHYVIFTKKKLEMNKLEFYEFIIEIEDKVWKVNNATYSNQQIR